MARSPAASAFSATSLRGERLADTAATLRARLLRFEQLLDEALAEGGALCGDLVQARRALGLSAVVGQPVVAAVTQALGSLADARGQAVHTHRTLDRMGQALGYDDPDFGDGGKDPFTTATAGPSVDA